MTWDGVERRKRRRSWEGEDKRMAVYEYKEEKKNGSVKIAVWAIPVIMGIIFALAGYLTSWGSVTSRLTTAEKQNVEDAEVNKVVYQQQTIIPVIQRDIQEIKSSQKSMEEKEDRHYEALMKAVKA